MPSANRFRSVAALIVALTATTVHATEVIVAGLFPNKAVVQINGGEMRTLSLGEVGPLGVKLLSVATNTATFNIDGARVTLPLGMARTVSNTSSTAVAQLNSDGQGHFKTTGLVNGKPVRMMVDTGSTFVVLPARDAQELGINYLSAPKSSSRAANGTVYLHTINLDSVRVGDLVLHDIAGAVIDGEGPAEALLGMSFLGQTNIRLEGDTMTLSSRSGKKVSSSVSAQPAP